MGLLVTFILGLFIVLGAVIVLASKNDRSFINFSLGLAFSVIVMLILFDLLPETYEIFSAENSSIISIAIILVTIIIGMGILKILDYYIPDHETHDKTNLTHIGLIASIALIMHNIVEGMAVYTATEASFKTGYLIAIGVGLHNIPLGMIITSSLFQSNKNKKKTILMISIIALSTFVGGLLMFLLGGISEMFEGVILGITLGMLVYISFFELLPKIIEIKDKKKPIYGLIVGIIIIVIAMLLGGH